MVRVARSKPNRTQFRDKEKPTQIRDSNIQAAKAVADSVRTSLGPKGILYLYACCIIIITMQLFIAKSNNF